MRMLQYRDLSTIAQLAARSTLKPVPAGTDFLAALESIYTYDKILSLVTPNPGETLDNEVSATKMEDIRRFFAERWEVIRDTKLAYPHYTNLQANRLCVQLAQIAAPYLEGHCAFQLLMPTLTETTSSITYTDLNETGLHTFVLGDDDTSFIEVLECLSSVSGLGVLYHTSKVDVETRRAVLLTESEQHRVINHTPEALKYYTFSMELYNKQHSTESIGSMLKRLIDGLRSGGVSHREGGGTEYNAGSGANQAIVDFAEFLETLTPGARSNLMGRQDSTNKSFSELWNRLTRSGSTDYRDVTYCVQLLAGSLDNLLGRNHDLYTITGKRKIITSKPLPQLEQQIADAKRACEAIYQRDTYTIHSPTYDPTNELLCSKLVGFLPRHITTDQRQCFNIFSILNRLSRENYATFLDYMHDYNLIAGLEFNPLILAQLWQELADTQLQGRLLEILEINTNEARHIKGLRNPTDLVEFLQRFPDEEARLSVLQALEQRTSAFSIIATPHDAKQFGQILRAIPPKRWNIIRWEMTRELVVTPAQFGEFLYALQNSELWLTATNAFLNPARVSEFFSDFGHILNTLRKLENLENYYSSYLEFFRGYCTHAGAGIDRNSHFQLLTQIIKQSPDISLERLTILLTGNGLQALKEYLITPAEAALMPLESLQELLRDPKLRILREHLIPLELLRTMPIAHLRALSTKYGIQALREKHITPAQVAAMSIEFLQEMLFTESGLWALREHAITLPENKSQETRCAATLIRMGLFSSNIPAAQPLEVYCESSAPAGRVSKFHSSYT